MLGDSKKLRLTENQVKELDRFYKRILSEMDENEIKKLNNLGSSPFMDFCKNEGYTFFNN